MDIPKKNRKLIVKPVMVTWNDAKSMAKTHCGRLLYPREMEAWAENEIINVSIWLDYENESETDYACYFDGKLSSLRYQPKNSLALLVILADGPALKKQTEETRAMVERVEASRKQSRTKRWRK